MTRLVASDASGVMLRSSPQGCVSKHAHALGLLLFCLLAFFASGTLAQTYPALTGRVVDGANLLKPEERAALEAKLKAHEDKTSDQVVVATVPSLGGREIEDYANGLYRAWKLGTADKNNGALLLVAPTERKVRIEVGYGLEGALTDALTGTIIRVAIAPRFKQGDFAGGIAAGADAILSILTGDAAEWNRKGGVVRTDDAGSIDWVTILVVGILLIIVLRGVMRERHGTGTPYRSRGGGWIVPTSGWGGGGWSSGSGGGFGGGGGFSGGGGSSGGGGASGSW